MTLPKEIHSLIKKKNKKEKSPQKTKNTILFGTVEKISYDQESSPSRLRTQFSVHRDTIDDGLSSESDGYSKKHS